MEKVTHSLPVQLESIDQKNRRITFIASDETVDRYGTSISVDGWDLRNFRKNPVFLFGHNYGSPAAVIGRVIRTEKNSKQLKIVVDFVPREINPVAEMVYQMYTAPTPFLNAVSVGFIPYAFEDKEMTYDKAKEEKSKGKTPLWRIYTRQELLEVSAVIVPANPNALVDEMKAAGFDPALLMAARACMPEVGDPQEIQQLANNMTEWLKKSAPAASSESSDIRAGATISKKNRMMLEEARDMINKVLNGGEEDDEDEGEEEGVASPTEVPPTNTNEAKLDQLAQTLSVVAGTLDALTKNFDDLSTRVDVLSNSLKEVTVEKTINNIDESEEDLEKVSLTAALNKFAALGESQK